MLVPVVLSGGSGTRLWPLSRETYPKQLLPLLGRQTLLQATLERLRGIERMAPPIVVCNESHRFMVAEQLRDARMAPGAIVLEPIGKNTAPAATVAALLAIEHTKASDADPILLLLPADHLIREPARLRAAVATARAAAEAGRLVTFGVVPRGPETGYGYIRRGEGAGPAYPVAEFVEKPDIETARRYVDSGAYLWNSGMFMFQASTFLDHVRELAPAIAQACERAVTTAVRDLDFTRLSLDAFGSSPSDSIDYAVMEKTTAATVVALDAGWSDVGSWSALHEARPADAHGNVVVGDVAAEATTGCYLHSTSRLVATVGLVDHVVVETKDAVLVAPRSRVQDVKLLVNRLKQEGRHEPLTHREVFRPWGSYDSVDAGERFQVKRLVVRPGASMSLQLHHHRAEHWVVVSGTARITHDDKQFLLRENESTYIPIGTKHRIENPGQVPLHIVEVQSGTYLGEDDIVRFEDKYGRQGETS